mmetsp:Transcript_7769/g.11526  ORF Transcript_7769/g.11526 Transcript_7769/m.11526 type:complete len:390 (+) Transcript_7769:46-1215(+)
MCDVHCCGLKPLVFVLTAFLLIGILSSIFGVSFLIIFPYSWTDPTIKKYNNMVDNWKGKEESIFSKSKFYLEISPTNEVWKEKDVETKAYKFSRNKMAIPYANKYQILKPYTDTTIFEQFIEKNTVKFNPDDAVIESDNENDIPEVLYYSPSLMSSESEPNSNDTNTFYFVLSLNEDDTSLGQTFKSSLYILKEVSLNYCSGTRKGFVYKSKCHILFILDNLCIKVKKDEHQDYLPDKTYGGYGCSIIEQSKRPDLHKWAIGRYRIYDKKVNDTIDNIAYNFGNISISVQSGIDPYIYAQYITDGTLNFEELVHENLFFARAYVGYSSIFIGIIIVILSFCTFVGCCANSKSRKTYMLDNMREEHTALLDEPHNLNDASIKHPTSIKYT